VENHQEALRRLVGFFAGRFENRGLRSELRPRGERAESLKADVSFADMVMTVAIPAERHLRVVKMKEVNTIEPDRLGGLIDEVVHAALRTNVVSGGPCVRRIEANAELRMIQRF